MTDNKDLVGQDVVTDARIKQVAAAILANKSVKTVAEELKITPHMVNKIKKTPEFKEYLVEIADTVRRDAEAYLKHKFAGEHKAMYDAWKESLEDPKTRIEALKIGLKMVGLLDNKEDGAKEQGNLIVNLGSLLNPKQEIDITNGSGE